MNTTLKTEMKQENQKFFDLEGKNPSYGLLHNDLVINSCDYAKERAADRLLAYNKSLRKHVVSIGK